jgi:DNA-directed RNA polymerase alpha subunit
MNSFIIEPKVRFHLDEEKNLQFTLSNVNVSIANAIRRTILSDIPMVVFKTTPYEENKSNFITNTTRLNNEILKQRLSCIPIHITDPDIPLNN